MLSYLRKYIQGCFSFGCLHVDIVNGEIQRRREENRGKVICVLGSIRIVKKASTCPAQFLKCLEKNAKFRFFYASNLFNMHQIRNTIAHS